MPETPAVPDEELVRELVAAIRSVRYGQVQVTIHDARVVEICTTERVRLPKPERGSPGS